MHFQLKKGIFKDEYIIKVRIHCNKQIVYAYSDDKRHKKAKIGTCNCDFLHIGPTYYFF